MLHSISDPATSSGSIPGSPTMLSKRRIQSAKRSRIAGGFTIFMAMSRSGARTSTVLPTIRRVLQLIPAAQPVPAKTLSACCAAVPGNRASRCAAPAFARPNGPATPTPAFTPISAASAASENRNEMTNNQIPNDQGIPNLQCPISSVSSLGHWSFDYSLVIGIVHWSFDHSLVIGYCSLVID